VNGGDDPDRPYEKVGNIALVGMWLLVKIKGKGKRVIYVARPEGKSGRTHGKSHDVY
jgi:hypothetical protein